MQVDIPLHSRPCCLLAAAKLSDSFSPSEAESDSESDEDGPKKERKIPAAAGYDSDESLHPPPPMNQLKERSRASELTGRTPSRQ